MVASSRTNEPHLRLPVCCPVLHLISKLRARQAKFRFTSMLDERRKSRFTRQIPFALASNTPLDTCYEYGHATLLFGSDYLRVRVNDFRGGVEYNYRMIVVSDAVAEIDRTTMRPDSSP
jgi:hypothetical protein